MKNKKLCWIRVVTKPNTNTVRKHFWDALESNAEYGYEQVEFLGMQHWRGEFQSGVSYLVKRKNGKIEECENIYGDSLEIIK